MTTTTFDPRPFTRNEAVAWFKREIKYLLPDAGRRQQRLPHGVKQKLIDRISNSRNISRAMWDALRIAKLIYGLPITDSGGQARQMQLVNEAEELCGTAAKRDAKTRRNLRPNEPRALRDAKTRRKPPVAPESALDRKSYLEAQNAKNVTRRAAENVGFSEPDFFETADLGCRECGGRVRSARPGKYCSGACREKARRRRNAQAA